MTGCMVTIISGCAVCLTVSPSFKQRLTPEQEAEVVKMVDERSTLPKHAAVRQRHVDLSRVIEACFGVHLVESSGGLRHNLRAYTE